MNNIKDGAGKIRGSLGIIIALLMIGISFVKVVTTETTSYILPGKNTLTISHWQMEDGYREGLQQIIDNFIALKREQGIKVNIIQSVVPWRGYKQWGVTQLVGGKPTDLMEMNFSADYVGKYFYSLDQYLGRVNPYNEGSPVAGLPWKQTFLDGLKSAWNKDLLGYYGIGTSMHTWRIYYNKDLLEKITGSPDAPKTFGEWLKQCQEIINYSERTREMIVPIVVRGFDGGTVRHLYQYFSGEMNYNWLDKVDLNIDGEASPFERYNAVVKGIVSWDSEEIKSPIMMLRNLARYFQKGFTSVDLEQAKFLFLQNRAVYLPEGSWQSKSLFANAPSQLGVFRIPAPGPGSPYQRFYDGSITEISQRLNGVFGITRKTRNFDLALDFLMFMTSYEQNSIWNRSAEWSSAIRFAKTTPLMKKFKPNIGGIPNIGGFYEYFGRTRTEFFQELTTFLVEQQESGKEYYNFERLIADLHDTYQRLAGEDTRENLRTILRGLGFQGSQMSQLDTISAYCRSDTAKMAGIDMKKKMVLESIVQSELNYNFYGKLYREAFE